MNLLNNKIHRLKSTSVFHPRLIACYFRLAKEDDVKEIFEIVKSAYALEKGNTGYGFKNEDRYTSTKSVVKDLPFIWVLRLPPNDLSAPVSSKLIVGCVKAVIDERTQIVEIGPVAVRPEFQVVLICYEFRLFNYTQEYEVIG